jgi:hypothetical protein
MHYYGDINLLIKSGGNMSHGRVIQRGLNEMSIEKKEYPTYILTSDFSYTVM